MTSLNRRDFIKLAGASALGLGLPGVGRAQAGPLPPAKYIRPLFYGRALLVYVTIYTRPSIFAGHARVVESSTVLPIYEVLEGENGTANSKTWYRTLGGYVHKTNVQPCRWHYNQPVSRINAADGRLVEITIPYVDAYRRPSTDAAVYYRLYYGTTYWAYEVVEDDEGQVWYRLWDDKVKTDYYALAEAFRFLTREELAPLSPDVEDKLIRLDLTTQTLRAYEGDRLVREARMSSGDVFTGDDGNENDYSTPLGTFHVQRKRPERHMSGSEDLAAAGDDYDLPGVPWVTYFNGAIAFHGTYWHNHYGRPMSHGCINLTPEDSLWVWRWTTPLTGYGDGLIWGEGTRVIVEASPTF